MKKVQIGRSRMAEELARPTWNAVSAPVENKKKAAPQQPQKVSTIAPAPTIQRKLRAAAYARVSTDLDSQETSIENQREHYLHYIEGHEDWELAGIYEESGVSGTKADTRPELQKLLHDCEAGAVDVIITKSISRFARNTSECLEMVRKLTGIGIRLIFEKENIDTETMESEFLLTLLAAFAESESASISTNQKWSIRRRFQAGTYKGGKVPYGYRRSKKGYTIHPAEAATVRRIFNALADGKGTVVIARELNADKVPTWTESYKGEEGKGRWRSNSIIAIVRNEFYTGDTLYQNNEIIKGVNMGTWYTTDGADPSESKKWTDGNSKELTKEPISWSGDAEKTLRFIIPGDQEKQIFPSKEKRITLGTKGTAPTEGELKDYPIPDKNISYRNVILPTSNDNTKKLQYRYKKKGTDEWTSWGVKQ